LNDYLINITVRSTKLLTYTADVFYLSPYIPLSLAFGGMERGTKAIVLRFFVLSGATPSR
jgi:hypothetical protein